MLLDCTRKHKGEYEMKKFYIGDFVYISEPNDPATHGRYGEVIEKVDYDNYKIRLQSTTHIGVKMPSVTYTFHVSNIR
jgi:Cu/Ag efflux protein CusF